MTLRSKVCVAHYSKLIIKMLSSRKVGRKSTSSGKSGCLEQNPTIDMYTDISARINDQKYYHV